MQHNSKQLVFLSGVLLAGLVLGTGVRPGGMPTDAWHMLLVALGASALWMSEVVPMGITSLMVILALSLLEILPLREGLSLVFHPVSAIVFAGFCLAAALQKYNLDRRLSLIMMVKMGSRSDRAILAMMISTAVLSLVISNSAATAVMVAIALGLLRSAGVSPGQSNLGRVLIIGIAFAANIGGMGTPAGTPGNAITIALLRDLTQANVSFLAWMAFAMPLVITLVPTAWWILLRFYPPEIACLDLSAFRRELRELGGLTFGERRVASIFAATVFLWALEPFVSVPPDWTSMVALMAAIALSLPAVGVLTWTDIHRHTGWHIFLLVGGGLALGTGLIRTGAVVYVAGLLTERVAHLPVGLVVALVATATAGAIVIFCTISGTATTLVPLSVGLALSAGWNPYLFALTAGMSSSFAFLLPANSAPNALAYGSGFFKPTDMLRAGLVIMAVAVISLAVAATTLWPLMRSLI